MDADSALNGNKKIVSMQVVQVSEVKNSNQMEVEGLRRCLDQTKADGLNLSVLATDRHVMVSSVMKKEYKDIDHQYDIWHLAKNIIKKLWVRAKVKNCVDLGPWIQSIANHMWWCAATCDGNAQLLKEKWLSILIHIRNCHKWSGTMLFHKCGHVGLTKEQKKKTPWLDPTSDAYLALQKIVTDTRLLNALPNLTQFCHTGELEVFHSMLLKYCLKRQHFHYEAMKARLMLAALDWNSQTRETRKDANGEDAESLVWSKRKGKWIKRLRYVKTTANHLQPLIVKVLETKAQHLALPKMQRPENLPRHVARHPKPDADDVDMTRKSRFGK
jgi:hypothetical protein